MCIYEKELIAQNVAALFPLFQVKVPALESDSAKLFITEFVTSIVPDLCDYLSDQGLTVLELFQEVGTEIGSLYLALENDLVNTFNIQDKCTYIYVTIPKLLDNTFIHPPLHSKNNVNKTLEEYVIVLNDIHNVPVGLNIYSKPDNSIIFGTTWAILSPNNGFNLPANPTLAKGIVKIIKGEFYKEYQFIPYTTTGLNSVGNAVTYTALLGKYSYMMSPELVNAT